MTIEIVDAVAEDLWEYELPDGTVRQSRIVVGRPRPDPNDPNGDWCCPFFVEWFTSGVMTAHGVGPVDALANAMRFVSDRFGELRNVSPRAEPGSR